MPHSSPRAASPAAVAGVLDLEQHAVGIVEDQLGRIRGVDHHRPLGRRRAQVVAPAVVGPGEDARLDPQLGELPHHPLRVEVLHVHAEVVAHAAAGAGPPLAQGDELRPGADRHDRQVAAVLAGVHRQVEEALVEVERALEVGDADGDVVQVQNGERGRLRLRPQSRAGQQRGGRRQEVSSCQLQARRRLPGGRRLAARLRPFDDDRASGCKSSGQLGVRDTGSIGHGPRWQRQDCHAIRGEDAMTSEARMQRMRRMQRQRCKCRRAAGDRRRPS